jgi:hypothetical protein
VPSGRRNTVLYSLLTIVITDQNDESLQKWKASLGLGQGKDISDPNDPRKCIILSLGLEVEGRDDIIIDLRSPGAVEALESKPFIIKEGARFRMKAQFKVQHEILAGLKYLQKVTRMGVSDKLQEMMVGILAILAFGYIGTRLTVMVGLIRSQHRRKAILREEVYVHILSRYTVQPLTPSQSSPRPLPLACSAVATTPPFRSSSTMTTRPIYNSSGLSISRRTGNKRWKD